MKRGIRDFSLRNKIIYGKGKGKRFQLKDHNGLFVEGEFVSV